ncbi:GIY-YIG nuclease family protein [Patescibacteria group bacterium]
MYLEKNKLRTLPKTPGIYIFFINDIAIYVGKAVNLSNRVKSYFSNILSPKTKMMIREASRLKFIKVESELEALLLEAKMIKKLQPKYNILAKDDKNHLYIKITKEPYPRVITVRKRDSLPFIGIYGPFPSSNNVYSVLRMLRRIFPYSDHKVGRRPCLYSHMKLCNPCPNEIELEKDKSEKVKNNKVYLKNISSIKMVLSGRSKYLLKNMYKDMDKFSINQEFEEATVLRDQIAKLEYITQPKTPEDEFLKNPNLYEDIKSQQLKDLTQILIRHFKNIKSLRRIECFDIAHISGKSAAASMVTFVNAEADKSLYRQFKIRQKRTLSDYHSMMEIAQRRKKNLEKWGKPNLIIVDGGISQVKAFNMVFEKVGINVVGIAKYPDRLILSNKTKITLKGNSLRLLQKIRNEAHRFARVYHKKLLDRSTFPKHT